MDSKFKDRDSLQNYVANFLQINSDKITSIEISSREILFDNEKSFFETIYNALINLEQNFLFVFNMPCSEYLLSKYDKKYLHLLDNVDIYSCATLEPIEAFEECILSINLEGVDKAFFRSWRDRESALYGWGFSNALYCYK